MPTVSRLFIHPVKSLDPQEVAEARVLPSGALMHDRAFAIVDAQGDFVTAKRFAAIHSLRSLVDVEAEALTLRDQSHRGLPAATFHLHRERAVLLEWLSDFFGFPVRIVEDRSMGFPDDPASPGPTIISTATLDAIAEWFELPADEVGIRFRANIEIGDTPPFWEDRLFGRAEELVPFSIGRQRFLGVNPCQRCVVPSRDPRSGTLDPAFARRFIEQRRASLPDWSTRERFDHFYRAAINTRLLRRDADEVVRVGDRCALGEAVLVV